MTNTPVRSSSPTLLVLLVIFLGLFTFMVWPYIISLVMGLMLAVLTRPLHNRLRSKGLGANAAAAAAIAAVMLAVIVPVVIFSVVAVNQGINLSSHLSGERGTAFLQAATDKAMMLAPVRWVVANPDIIKSKGVEFLQSAGAALSTMILVRAASLPDLALKLMLAFMAWYYMLVEGEAFINWMMVKTRLDKHLRSRLGSSFKETVASTVWATSAAAASQAFVVMIGFWALGVPCVFLASGATFIFAWIPILGSLPVCLAGGIYLYFTGSMTKLAIMAVVALVAGFMDNIVRPIVMKGHGDMHPLLALVAIFAGIDMFGILGVIFGPIVAAMLVAILEAWAPPAENSQVWPSDEHSS